MVLIGCDCCVMHAGSSIELTLQSGPVSVAGRIGGANLYHQ